jgi:cation diffusion facilitator CzcD-associated flavoprotein CzcO
MQSNSNGITSGPKNEPIELDAIVIGGGFSGVYLLYRLRQAGFKAKIIEAGSALGGVWHSSTYPGARVDSQYPVYQLSIPEVYNTFAWTEQYPGAAELQRYFQHVDQVLDISKDTFFNTRVTDATWLEKERKWHVACDGGLEVKARFLNCCLGFAAKPHFPDWEGLNTFEGSMIHSSAWPEEDLHVKEKVVGCVGSGATGVQIAQEIAKTAKRLKVFLRTPNTCIPMRQGPVDAKAAVEDLKSWVPEILTRDRYLTDSGFWYPNPTKKVMDTPKEKRDAILEDAWAKGGFRLAVCFTDILTDEVANRYVYDFWARKVRERITDPVKRDILAPLTPLHPFGGKRPSMEQDYYEQMDKKHVEIVDLQKNPISHVVPEGIVTQDGVLHKMDVMAIATGFDSLTGSFARINIHGVDGEDLEQKWSGEQGALSYLGLAVNNFPVR